MRILACLLSLVCVSSLRAVDYSARAKAALALATAPSHAPAAQPCKCQLLGLDCNCGKGASCDCDTDSVAYANAYRQAKTQGRDLFVWVNRADKAADYPSAVHCRVRSLNGNSSPRLIVGRYQDGKLVQPGTYYTPQAVQPQSYMNFGGGFGGRSGGGC